MKFGKIGTGLAAIGALAGATAAQAENLKTSGVQLAAAPLSPAAKLEQNFGDRIRAVGLTVPEVTDDSTLCTYLGMSSDEARECQIAAIRAKRGEVQAALAQSETNVAEKRNTLSIVETERDAAKAVLAAVRGQTAASKE